MKGTHGTFREVVEKILENGFKVDGDGHRYGWGAYFWDYESEEYRDEAITLAVSHWYQSYRTGCKRPCAETNCAVLDVEFEEQILLVDTLNKRVREKLECFLKLHEQKYIDAEANRHPVCYNELAGVYDYFIAELELSLNQVVNAVRFTVNVNRKYFPTRYALLNSPTCVVVRTPGESIKNIEPLFVDGIEQFNCA